MNSVYADIAEMLKGDKCHFCDKIALYNDMAGYKLIGVCKKHLNYHTS